MKRPIFKILLLFVVGAMFFAESFAEPALMGFVKVKQADGKYITVQTHGDEFFNYVTTIDGYPVSKHNGIYYHSTISQNGYVTISKVRANDPSERDASERAMLSTKTKAQFAFSETMINSMRRTEKSTDYGGKFPSTGKVRSVVILVNFSDVKMQVHNTKEAFIDMLNLKGYNYNSAVGSAADYFKFNSKDLFDPTFDVFGPVTLPGKLADYGENNSSGSDKDARGMVVQACSLANDAGLDFSQYDFDNDGKIDNVFIFFAGFSESNSGVSSDAIWPHKWTVLPGTVLNGKILYTYACSSELSGNSGIIRAGIGTFCHEFSHVLGLKDTYDTGVKSTGQKKTIGIDGWSLMTNGSHTNNGRTPPLYCAFEREDVGWITIPELPAGEITLAPLSENKAYKLSTSIDGEYFTFENRNKNTSVWDAKGPGSAPVGMLILHIDKSYTSYNGVISFARWTTNKVNVDNDHMCARIVISDPKGWTASKNILYPGQSLNTAFGSNSIPVARDWSNKPLPRNISDIKISGQNITFVADDGKSLVTTSSQNTITCLWTNPSSTSWRVSYKTASGSYSAPQKTTVNTFVITGLLPTTAYDIKIEGSTDDVNYTEVFTKQVTTLALTQSPAATTFSYDFAAATPTTLGLTNIDNAELVTWYVDGAVQSSNMVTLSAGQHKIVGKYKNKGKIYRLAKTVMAK